MDLRYYLRGLGIGIIVTAVIMGIISRGKQEPLDNEEIKARAQELGMVEGAGVLSDMETQQQPQEEQNAAEAPDAEARQRDPSSTKEATEEEEGVAMDSADGVNSDADSSGTDNPDEDTAEEDSSQKSNAQESNAQESNAQESGEENEQPSPEPDRGGEEAGGAEDPQQDMETASGDETDAESEDSVTIEIVSGEGSFSVCTKLEKAGLIASASSFDRYLYDKGYDRKLRIGIHEIPADAKPEEIAEIVAFGGH